MQWCVCGHYKQSTGSTSLVLQVPLALVGPTIGLQRHDTHTPITQTLSIIDSLWHWTFEAILDSLGAHFRRTSNALGMRLHRMCVGCAMVFSTHLLPHCLLVQQAVGRHPVQQLACVVRVEEGAVLPEDGGEVERAQAAGQALAQGREEGQLWQGKWEGGREGEGKRVRMGGVVLEKV